ASKEGFTTWLDATPAGAAVYGPLGFTPALQLRRFRFGNSTRPASALQLPPCDLKRFIARDVSAMGFDRSALLTELSGRPGSRLLSNSDAVARVRDGLNARPIGPVFAEGQDRPRALGAEADRSEAAP